MASQNLWWRALPLVMFLLVLPLPFCHGKYDRHIVSDKDMTRRKEACYIDIDNGLRGRQCRSSWTAKENCALRCVSATCYDRIYGEDSLEEGEVDFKRGREYRTCLRREIIDEARTVK
ncbi:unnamed protein product [Calypogeia fissa]